MEKRYRPVVGREMLFALENTPVDYVSKVDESLLQKFGLRKGDFNGTSDKDQVLGLEKELKDFEVECGGSAANVASGYSNLGLPAAFSGSIGNDSNGDLYKKSLIDSNVRPYLSVRDEKNGVCHVLVTPDGERTFLVYMGASSDLKPEDVPKEAIAHSGFLHSTAYALDSISAALEKGIEYAKANNVLVSFDLASRKSIERHEKKLDDILSNTDILFVNREEADAFGFKKGDELKLIEYMTKHYGIALVAYKLREDGAIISSGHGNKTAMVMSYKINVINTNGAGDGFAAGLLYGLTSNYDLFNSGKIATFYASRIIMQESSKISYKLFDIEGML